MDGQITPSQDSLRLRELALSKRATLYELMNKYGATQLSIFGSVANGTANSNSDIDFLVDKIETPGLFALAEFMLELEDILHTEVDLVVSTQVKQNREKSILDGEIIRL